MGLIKFGGGVAGISGKIGGTVFARNKAGAYARNWAVPVNPSTPIQNQARLQLTNAVADWMTLTAPQVAGWNAMAVTMTRINRQGDSYVPSGRQVFIEQYINASTTGVLTPRTIPGVTNVSPSIGACFIEGVVAAAGLLTELSVNVSGMVIPSGEPPSDCFIQVYGAPAHPAQRSNVNKQKRLVLQDAADTFTPNDMFTAFNSYFGATSQIGQLVTLWVRLIDFGTNFASPYVKIERQIEP